MGIHPNNVNILVVDDLEPNHRIMKKIMEPYGYQLHSAYNGHEGIMMLQRKRIDLCVTDIHMPEIDGILMVDYVRTEIDLTLPIILLAGTADAEERDIALGVGMDDFIFKPIQVNQVKAMLQKYIAS
jgi:CheY-like chemotaxis protein